MTKKFLSQCEYIQYWYDTADRLIYIQDGRMRSQGLYRFYLYDNLSRVVGEGTCSACNRGSSVTHTAFCVSNAGFLGTGYSLDNSLNLENARLEVVNYYDNYDFLNLPLFKDNAALKKESSHATPVCAYGLSTGTITATSRGELLLNTLYYDAKGQVTESHRTLPDNVLLVTKNSYTFTGNPEKTEQTLYKDGKVHRSVMTNSYNNHNDKLEITTLSIDGQPAKQVASIDYDDLGRIGDLYHGGKNNNSTEKTSYTYNLRGWTTDIASKNFEEHLTYNAGSQGTPYYSGNISTQQWKTGGDGVLRGYKFKYDMLNRLTNAAYGEGPFFSNNQGHYNETITGYTSNGAIEGIVRNGLMQNGQYGAIDDLDITLNGNQLDRVDDKAAPVLRNGAFDFFDNKIKTEAEEYSYDENGALIYDANRGITNIEYDMRNNPVLIKFSDGSTTEYVYTAKGEKLRTIHHTSLRREDVSENDPILCQHIPALEGSSNDFERMPNMYIDSTDYLENFIFENGKIDKYLFEGGYYSYAVGHPARTGGDEGGYYYYLTDHLGNNRVIISEDGVIYQLNHYYPFGAIYADAGKNPDFQKYKYTGKELDLTHGLNTYDHGARQNYSLLGVWDRVDPLAEKHYNISPYAVCVNNPVLINDTDGNDGYISIINNSIVITCDVYFYGKGATKEVVNQMQEDVNKVWGGNFKIMHNKQKYNVNFLIRLHLFNNRERQDPLIILDSWNPYSRKNYIELKRMNSQSYTKVGDEGVWRSTGRYGLHLSNDDPAPHEVGHLLGEEDKYDTQDSKNPTFKGWHGNVMSNGTKVDNRNINEILHDAWIEYDKWKKKGGKGKFTYEINP